MRSLAEELPVRRPRPWDTGSLREELEAAPRLSRGGSGSESEALRRQTLLYAAGSGYRCTPALSSIHHHRHHDAVIIMMTISAQPLSPGQPQPESPSLTQSPT